MACHELIEDYLRALEGRLPGPVVEELAGGLIDGYEDQLARLGDPRAAARAAIADFGDADTVTAAFVRASPGRGAALRLLATGPLVGLTWAATLVLGHAWSGRIPLGLVGAVLAFAVAALHVAVREHRYQAVRLAALAGAAGLVIIDVAMFTAVVLALGRPEWMVLPALTASSVRAVLTARALPALCRRCP